jgi:hypothetical protein
MIGNIRKKGIACCLKFKLLYVFHRTENTSFKDEDRDRRTWRVVAHEPLPHKGPITSAWSKRRDKPHR